MNAIEEVLSDIPKDISPELRARIQGLLAETASLWERWVDVGNQVREERAGSVYIN